MNIIKSLAAFAASAVTIAGLAHGAAAAEAYIAGDIFWGAGTPTTAYSEAGDISAFSFDVNASLPAGNPSTATVTNFTYTLNNSTVGIAPIDDVTFYSAANNGMFDLNFVGGTVVSIYGADIGNIGLGQNVINVSTGYGITAGMQQTFPGTAAGAVVVSVSAVPLPAALPMFGAGLAALGFVAWRRKAA